MTKRKGLVRPEDTGREPPKETWKPSEGTRPMIGAPVAPELKEQVEEIAKAEGIYVSDLLRWLLENFLQEYEDGTADLPKRIRDDIRPYTLE